MSESVSSNVFVLQRLALLCRPQDMFVDDVIDTEACDAFAPRVEEEHFTVNASLSPQFEVVLEGFYGFVPDWHDALLAALACQGDLFEVVEPEIGQIEIDKLLISGNLFTHSLMIVTFLSWLILLATIVTGTIYIGVEIFELILDETLFIGAVSIILIGTITLCAAVFSRGNHRRSS